MFNHSYHLLLVNPATFRDLSYSLNMSTSDNLQTSSDTVAMQYLLALVILNISIITTSPDIIL